MTSAGNIDNTQGAAIGTGNQAQNTTVTVTPTLRDMQIDLLEQVSELNTNVAVTNAKLDQVTDRTATTLMGVNARMYQLERTIEQQQVRNETDRHTGQAEHAEQHKELNRRMDGLEALFRESAERRDRRMEHITELARIAANEARFTAQQARQFQFVIGAAIIAIMVAMFVLVGALGRIQGWW